MDHIAKAPQPVRAEVRQYSDVVVFPRRIYLQRRAATILDQSNQPAITPVLRDGWELTPPRVLSKRQHIKGRAILVDSWSNGWGSLLMEYLPQLMLARRLDTEDPILTAAGRLPANMLVLASALGIDRRRFTTVGGVAFCDEAYVCDLPLRLRTGMHTLVREGFQDLRAIGVPPKQPMDRVFVSRSRVANRRLSNEADVEAAFARLGFSIVSPELLSIEEQIGLFSAAKMVVGPSGLAMHNMVFAGPGTPVLILAPDTHAPVIDCHINPEPGRLGYVFGRSLNDVGKVQKRPWTIDVEQCRTAALEHFGL